jgi:hypothetical protein
MLHIIGNIRRSAVAAAVPLLLAIVLLAACGSSSTGSSSSTGASASASTGSSTATSTTGPPKGAGGGRFAGLRTCLQKEGITLPKRTPGQGGAGGGGLLGGGGGGPALPAGVTRAQFEAAIKKCGGTAGGGVGGGAARFSTPAAKAALVKFAACMRENGQNVPAPNTSGKGPVFNTNGLKTTSAAFKAAQTKCSSLLSGVLGRPNGGAPPAAG